jgi:pimeloyl-ACP methyl ester carboxylesterase
METVRTLTVNDGLTLHYRLWRTNGRRPLLVLLHGMASNLTRWSEFIEHTTLKESFDILRIDLRGHGESFTRRAIGMERWREDLEAILNAEGYEHAVFVGHSLGANVALHFAAYYPARVVGLVLIDPVFTEALRGQALWVYRFTPLVRAAIALLRFLNWMGLRRGSIENRDLRKLDEDARMRLLGTGNDDDFVKRYTSPLADIKHFGTANYLQEFLELARAVPATPTLRAPMLVLISRAVTFTDTAATRVALKRYPHAQIDTLSAYHWPLTEKPVEVRNAIEIW